MKIMKPKRSPLVLLLAGMLSAALVISPALAPAAPLGSQTADTESVSPRNAAAPGEIDFPLLAGGEMRESREFRDFAGEATFVVFIIGVFFAGAAFWAGR